MAYQSINPNNGKLLKSFEHLTAAQLEKSRACAQHCYQTCGRCQGSCRKKFDAQAANFFG